MDLREIHALHAQYAEHSVVIDMAAHVNAMPALPAPGAGRANAPTAPRSPRRFARYGRLTLIFVAAAVAAAGTGMATARLWTALHPQPTLASGGAAKPAARPAAPPRAAVALAASSAAVQGPLAHLDPHALLAGHTEVGAREHHTTAASAVVPRAAASPIFETHAAVRPVVPREATSQAGRHAVAVRAAAAEATPNRRIERHEQKPAVGHPAANRPVPNDTPSTTHDAVARHAGHRQPRHVRLAAVPPKPAIVGQPATVQRTGRTGDVTLF